MKMNKSCTIVSRKQVLLQIYNKFAALIFKLTKTIYFNLKISIMIFREHSSNLTGQKKWNVDTDIVFEVMKNIIDRDDRNQAVLVSWDGDYIKMVKYLIKQWRFKKILFPNKHYSSLYRQLQDRFSVHLSTPDVRHKIEYKKRAA